MGTIVPTHPQIQTPVGGLLQTKEIAKPPITPASGPLVLHSIEWSLSCPAPTPVKTGTVSFPPTSPSSEEGLKPQLPTIAASGAHGIEEALDSQATCWPAVTTRAMWLHSCFSGILKNRGQGGPGLGIKCSSGPDLSLHPRQQQLPLPEPGGCGCVYLYFPSAGQEGPANTSGCRGIAGPEPQGRSPFGTVGGRVTDELGVARPWGAADISKFS